MSVTFDRTNLFYNSVTIRWKIIRFGIKSYRNFRNISIFPIVKESLNNLPPLAQPENWAERSGETR